MKTVKTAFAILLPEVYLLVGWLVRRMRRVPAHVPTNDMVRPAP